MQSRRWRHTRGHPDRDMADPGGVERVRTRLTPALVVSTLLLGCGASESPFELWDMRVGMPMVELDSISLHDQMASFTCVRAEGAYRRCSVPLRGARGRMDALVDTAGSVIELTFDTGAGLGGMDLGQTVGLIEATQELVKGWNRVVEPVTVGTPLEGQTDTWHAGNGRWTARIEWWDSFQPEVITVTDEEAMRAYRSAAVTAAEESLFPAPAIAGSGDDEAARAELRRLVQAQRAYRATRGTYAADLAALHFIPRDEIVVEVGGARSAGWWGRARTPEGGECVVWEGVPPPPEQERMLAGDPGEPDCR